jgi:hypothetical protein
MHRKISGDKNQVTFLFQSQTMANEALDRKTGFVLSIGQAQIQDATRCPARTDNVDTQRFKERRPQLGVFSYDQRIRKSYPHSGTGAAGLWWKISVPAVRVLLSQRQAALTAQPGNKTAHRYLHI